jgi:hypothetical protein
LLERHADEVIDDGRRGLVRNGYLPKREIMTGIGPVAVRCRRMRDRVGEGSERIRFSLPYARRSKSLEVPIPILYLKGTSTGEFEEAQVALGPKSACAGASVISGHHRGHPEGKKELVGPIDGTTNVIENAFATIRHRTVPKGRLSKQDRARHDLQTRRGRRESWQRLDGHNQLFESYTWSEVH